MLEKNGCLGEDFDLGHQEKLVAAAEKYPNRASAVSSINQRGGVTDARSTTADPLSLTTATSSATVTITLARDSTISTTTTTTTTQALARDSAAAPAVARAAEMVLAQASSASSRSTVIQGQPPRTMNGFRQFLDRMFGGLFKLNRSRRSSQI